MSEVQGVWCKCKGQRAFSEFSCPKSRDGIGSSPFSSCQSLLEKGVALGILNLVTLTPKNEPSHAGHGGTLL